MGKNRINLKMSNVGYDFLNKIIDNRIKVGKDRLDLIKSLDLVAKYFKENNESYIKMLSIDVEGEKWVYLMNLTTGKIEIN